MEDFRLSPRCPDCRAYMRISIKGRQEKLICIKCQYTVSLFKDIPSRKRNKSYGHINGLA